MTFHIHEDNHQGLVAHLVSYAPAIFFLVLVGGIILHINISINFVPPVVGWAVGAVLLAVGPIILLLSQRKRHTLYVPIEDRTCFNFDVGPYKYSRHPTYLGLFCLLVGFSFLINSLPILLLTAALGPFFTYWIIPKEEKLLENLCQDVYRDYKKRVRMWL